MGIPPVTPPPSPLNVGGTIFLTSIINGMDPITDTLSAASPQMSMLAFATRVSKANSGLRKSLNSRALANAQLAKDFALALANQAIEIANVLQVINTKSQQEVATITQAYANPDPAQIAAANAYTSSSLYASLTALIANINNALPPPAPDRLAAIVAYNAAVATALQDPNSAINTYNNAAKLYNNATNLNNVTIDLINVTRSTAQQLPNIPYAQIIPLTQLPSNTTPPISNPLKPTPPAPIAIPAGVSPPSVEDMASVKASSTFLIIEGLVNSIQALQNAISGSQQSNKSITYITDPALPDAYIPIRYIRGTGDSLLPNAIFSAILNNPSPLYGPIAIRSTAQAMYAALAFLKDTQLPTKLRNQIQAFTAQILTQGAVSTNSSTEEVTSSSPSDPTASLPYVKAMHDLLASDTIPENVARFIALNPELAVMPESAKKTLNKQITAAIRLSVLPALLAQVGSAQGNPKLLEQTLHVIPGFFPQTTSTGTTALPPTDSVLPSISPTLSSLGAILRDPHARKELVAKLSKVLIQQAIGPNQLHVLIGNTIQGIIRQNSIDPKADIGDALFQALHDQNLTSTEISTLDVLSPTALTRIVSNALGTTPLNVALATPASRQTFSDNLTTAVTQSLVMASVNTAVAQTVEESVQPPPATQEQNDAMQQQLTTNVFNALNPQNTVATALPVLGANVTATNIGQIIEEEAAGISSFVPQQGITKPFIPQEAITTPFVPEQATNAPLPSTAVTSPIFTSIGNDIQIALRDLESANNESGASRAQTNNAGIESNAPPTKTLLSYARIVQTIIDNEHSQRIKGEYYTQPANQLDTKTAAQPVNFQKDLFL